MFLHPHGTYFRKYVPYGCKTKYAKMCKKTFHDVPSFQNLQIRPIQEQIWSIRQMSTGLHYSAFPCVFHMRECLDVNFSETNIIAWLWRKTFLDLKTGHQALPKTQRWHAWHIPSSSHPRLCCLLEMSKIGYVHIGCKTVPAVSAYFNIFSWSYSPVSQLHFMHFSAKGNENSKMHASTNPCSECGNRFKILHLLI